MKKVLFFFVSWNRRKEHTTLSVDGRPGVAFLLGSRINAVWPLLIVVFRTLSRICLSTFVAEVLFVMFCGRSSALCGASVFKYFL